MHTKFRRLALIGCGLMGGSFALAAREAGQVEAITGYSVPRKDAELFHEKGIIDDVAASIGAAVADADLVMVAVPVAAMGSVLAELAGTLADDALLMDVSSTKRSVVTDAQRLLGRHLPNFVPAHPIAGKERAGAGEPHAILFRERKVILTPLDCTRSEQLQRARELWSSIGSEVSILTPAAHDRGLAAVSHLPHLLAFAYMAGLLEQADSAELLALGGPGFRDFSRIAGCDPTVWRDILRDNRDKTLEQLASFRHALAKFESLMQADDPEQLAVLLQQTSDARVAWQAVPARS